MVLEYLPAFTLKMTQYCGQIYQHHGFRIWEALTILTTNNGQVGWIQNHAREHISDMAYCMGVPPGRRT